MSRRLFARLAGMLAAGLIVLAGPAGALGLVGGVAATIEATAPATATSGVPFPVCGTVMGTPTGIESTMVPLEGKTAHWTSTTTAGTVTMAPPNTITDASGLTCTKATIVCEACSVTLMAAVESARGTAIVEVMGAGLPNTTATESPLAAAPTVLAALAVIVGASLILRRVLASRR